MKVRVVPATMRHAQLVGDHAREADREEIWSSDRLTTRQAAESGLEVSPGTRCALFDGKPACVFGVYPGAFLGGIPSPWMIGTPLIERHPLAFLRRCRPVVQDWSKRYTTLRNHVDARNTHAIAWLKWLGFAIHDAIPYGFDKLPFHPFTMGGQDNV